MLTVAEISTYIQDEMNDTSSAIQTSIKSLLNTKAKNFLSSFGWPFARQSATGATIASTQSYNLPKNIHRLNSVKITVGGVDYYPEPITSREQWDQLNEGVNANPTSDIVSYYALIGDKIHFYPIPASANTITFDYFARMKDLISGDFTDKTAGTVSVTNGSATVTGSGTSFAATDVGRYIRIDADGYFYKISGYTSGTEIALDRVFEGSTGSSLAYRLGTLIPIPEEAIDIIAYDIFSALWRKREDFSGQGGKAYFYKLERDRMLKEFMAQVNNRQSGATVKSIDSAFTMRNPNNFPINLS